ncbi:hypothetical protein D3C71_797410 [compost metagenome]
MKNTTASRPRTLKKESLFEIVQFDLKISSPIENENHKRIPPAQKLSAPKPTAK